MSFPAYETYKDSGDNCLGAVPIHWDAKRLRNIMSFSKGLTITKENLQDEGIPCVNYGEIHSKYGFRLNPTVHPLRCVAAEYLSSNPDALLRDGDFVFADTSEDLEGSGNFTHVRADIPLFAGYHTIIGRPREYVFPLFLAFQLHSQFLRSQIQRQVKGIKVFSVSQAVLKSVKCWLPPLDEQKAISSFLDVETSKIDGLVSEQRRLIELLKEKRQAVISHAVTKGLNPNAPMKPSGIQWLGDVPQHWELKPLRRFNCNVQTGPFGSQLHADEYISGGTPVVNPTHMVNGGIVPSDDITVNDDVLERLPHQRLEVGDVIFSRRGELGRCALVTEREAGWLCGTGSMILRLHQAEYDGGYLSLFLSLDVLRQFFESFSIGSVMNSLSSETLLSMPLIVPPIEEQHQIVVFAMERATLIDTLQAEAERAIELLQERRTALISAAVTGKIDVRQFAHQETA